MLRYATHVKNNSLYNTPPTFGVYVLGLVLQWIEKTGGLTAVQNILTWSFSPTATTLPAAPSNLTGTVISGSEIDISWTNNANNATGFLMFASITSAAFMMAQYLSDQGRAFSYRKPRFTVRFRATFQSSWKYAA